MTLGDLLKRVDIEKDKDKPILFSDGVGWSNCYMTNKPLEPIYIFEDTRSPFSDGG